MTLICRSFGLCMQIVYGIAANLEGVHCNVTFLVLILLILKFVEERGGMSLLSVSYYLFSCSYPYTLSNGVFLRVGRNDD